VALHYVTGCLLSNIERPLGDRISNGQISKEQQWTLTFGREATILARNLNQQTPKENLNILK
jgi:hypothetical protein